MKAISENDQHFAESLAGAVREYFAWTEAPDRPPPAFSLSRKRMREALRAYEKNKEGNDYERA